MKYNKPWMSHGAQLDQLIDRGLLVTNRPRAIDCLKRIGYYRLSGYWFAFRTLSAPVCPLDAQGSKPRKITENRIALDEFRAGASFQNAVDLYVFDKQLRMLAMDALERIEIALRVDVSYTLGNIDAFAYLKPELFHAEFSVKLDDKTGTTKHHAWLQKHASLINRSKEDFVQYNRRQYGLPLAIWIACEVWDFGALSTLFGGMRETEQDVIARQYGVSNGRIFASWLRALNYLRNICAHHSRLWNRNVIDQPKLPPVGEVPWVVHFERDRHARARCFLLLKIARHLLSIIHPASTWPTRMKDHLRSFPDLSHVSLNLAGSGAPRDWEQFW